MQSIIGYNQKWKVTHFLDKLEWIEVTQSTLGLDIIPDRIEREFFFQIYMNCDNDYYIEHELIEKYLNLKLFDIVLIIIENNKDDVWL